eukprot:GHVP01048280.1.p1 GENE.GHVP01048280.1~~GHVP01048280.1.p1  ORF type:complete len:1092 (+),score=217.28 GHVP01048280.1:19-3294(+)
MEKDQTTFNLLPEDPSFPQLETDILDEWAKNQTFKKSLKLREGCQKFTFFDGPPFATGLPHYGHILAGTMKDVVTRFQSQKGFYVKRRFGWDCHGLPVEYEIDKSLGIKNRQEVLDMGIDVYNEKCRSVVLRYTKEWQKTVERFGRWIDFENDYKTMDLSFMETVWWVVKSLFEKDLVYRDVKIMPYSTACKTPLSNFEANSNYHETHQSPSLIVCFKALNPDWENTYFVAWTTTPWTLPSNLALCVHPEFTYVKLRLEDGRHMIMEESRVQYFLKSAKIHESVTKIVDSFSGSSLAGMKYEHLFDFFDNSKWNSILNKPWRIIADSYVTNQDGTGIVHCAPGFGEDDYRVCLESQISTKGLELPCPVNADGEFTSEIYTFAGQHVHAADKLIKADLKSRGHILAEQSHTHSYPYCWRSDTPLIYKAVPSWFVRVEEIKDQISESNDKVNWVPSFVGEKRFKNWIQGGKDWCISRNRFWGTPLPIWVSEDFESRVVIGSVAELQKYTDEVITDLHRHFIDHITIPDPRGSDYPPLRRVDEVLDCWFESGSMPYAQEHYPFKDELQIPADFIGEGLDQTRGWFYTLMVLSTALFNQPPFKNVTVNGLILASDKKKMSKRLKNYPEPTEIANKYGADALRVYLVNSPAVRAETLCFQENGVKAVVRDILRPWYHSVRFLTQEVSRYERINRIQFSPVFLPVISLTNHTDIWIKQEAGLLDKHFHKEMSSYRLYTVVPKLLDFLDNLTKWYVRMNRERMRGNEGKEEANASLNTLFCVLFDINKLMASFTPFTSEHFHKILSAALPDGHQEKTESVHYLVLKEPSEIEAHPSHRAFERLRQVVALGRLIRDREKVPIKIPLRRLSIRHSEDEFIRDMQTLEKYLQGELHVLEVDLSTDMSQTELKARLNFPVLGPRLGKDLKAVQNAVNNLSSKQIASYVSTGKITVMHHECGRGDLVIVRQVVPDAKKSHEGVEGDQEVVVTMDLQSDDETREIALVRQLISRVQKLKKATNIQPGQHPTAFFSDVPVSVLEKVSGGARCPVKRLFEAESYVTEAVDRMMSKASLEETQIDKDVACQKTEVNDNVFIVALFPV